MVRATNRCRFTPGAVLILMVAACGGVLPDEGRPASKTSTGPGTSTSIATEPSAYPRSSPSASASATFVPGVRDLHLSGAGLTTVTGAMADITVGATFNHVSHVWPGELIPIDVPGAGCDWFGLSPVDDLAAVFDGDQLVAFVVANANIRTTGHDSATAGNARVGTSAFDVEAAHPRLNRFRDPAAPERLFLTAEYLPGSDLGITFYLWEDTVVNYRAGLISYTERASVC